MKYRKTIEENTQSQSLSSIDIYIHVYTHTHTICIHTYKIKINYKRKALFSTKLRVPHIQKTPIKQSVMILGLYLHC